MESPSPRLAATLVLLCGTFLGSLMYAQQTERAEKLAEAEVSTTEEGILIYKSKDGKFRYELDGRVLIDAAFYDQGKNELSNGVELRRGRLAIIATLWNDWTGQLDIDVADNQVEVKDAWISYNGFDSSYIRVGQFKEPFSLEELTSSRYITFMERGLPNAFAPGRHLGIAFGTWRKHLAFSTGLFGEEIGDTDKGEDEAYRITSRVTLAPVRDETKTVHLGLAVSYRTPDADLTNPNSVRFRSRPESHVDRARFLDTGRIRDVKNFTLYGLEGAAVFGRFSLQAEYIKTDVNRKIGKPDVSFDGGYIFASWFVTGESRPYLNQYGEFGRLIPKKKIGAWELALRYSMLDLNDSAGGVRGGRADDLTLGLNWYVNPNIRIMTNYVLVNNDSNATANRTLVGDDKFRVLQLRLQVLF